MCQVRVKCFDDLPAHSTDILSAMTHLRKRPNSMPWTIFVQAREQIEGHVAFVGDVSGRN